LPPKKRALYGRWVFLGLYVYTAVVLAPLIKDHYGPNAIARCLMTVLWPIELLKFLAGLGYVVGG